MSEKKPDSGFAQKCANAVGSVIGLACVLAIPAAFAGGVALLAMPEEKTFHSAAAVGGALVGISTTLCVCWVAVLCFFVQCITTISR